VSAGKVIRCAIYTRKSSEEGLDQSFNSLHAQREACEAYVLSQKHEGWEAILTEYDDGGFSGGNMDRPGLKRLLADIAAKRVDTVVVYKVDRLTRSLADFAKIVEQFDGQGVSFVSVTQQFNTTSSMGRLTLNVLLSFAQFEREVTGERIRDKIAASKRKGMWMGGVIPLGYDLNNRSLTINEAEAEKVRSIYQLYLELGCVSRLSVRLDELGIRSKNRTSGNGRVSGNAAFSRGSLYELLQNPLYLGEVRHKELRHPGQHKAIIKQEVWDRVQKRLAINRPLAAVHGGDSEASWLMGLLFDQDGNRFTPSHTTKGGRRYRYYVLQALTQGKKINRGHAARLPAKQIEGAVLHELESLARSPQRLLQLVSDTPSDPIEMSAIVRAVEAFHETFGLQQALTKTVVKVVAGTDSVTISVDPRRLRAAIGLRDEGCTAGIAELTLPMKAAHFRGGIRIKVAGDDSRSQEAPALLSALVKSRGWLEQILRGEPTSQRDLAAKEGYDERYVSRLLPLAFLSPEITEAVLDGTQHEHWSLDTLLGNVPLDWNEQRRLFSINT
jgi:site-specific DNA recombinase